MSVTISAKEVNELRQKTGSGMMDCKKALVESGGDFDKPLLLVNFNSEISSSALIHIQSLNKIIESFIGTPK